MNLQASVTVRRKANDGKDGKDGKNGKDAYNVRLSIESYVFGVDSNNEPTGNLYSYVEAYRGNTKLAATITNVTSPIGLTVEASNNGSENARLHIIATKSLSGAGTFEVTITVEGYEFVRTFSYGVAFKGEVGGQGLPGKIPVQKEWKIEDVHRNTKETVDYIYVRGEDAVTSYWYKLSSEGTRTAGAAPTGGTTPSGYERIDSLKDLALEVLIAEGANIAGFIFKKGKLISQKGTVNGEPSTEIGNPNYIPNIVIDGENSQLSILDGKFRGVLEALEGHVGSLTLKNGRLVSMTKQLEIDGEAGLIVLKDTNESPKTIIRSTNLPLTPSSFFAGVGQKTASLSSFKRTESGILDQVVAWESNSLQLSTASGESYTVSVPSLELAGEIYGTAATGSQASFTINISIYLQGPGGLKYEVASFNVFSIGNSTAADSYTTQEAKFTVSTGGSWRLRAEVRTTMIGVGTLHTSTAHVMGNATGITADQIVERSEIGNNGMVIADSALQYSFMVGDLYEIRRGNIGFKITSNGIKKSSNMQDSFPTWVDV